MRLVLTSLVLVLAFSTSTNAAIVTFDLLGVAGPGLLPGNERPVAASGTGSGGEIGPTGIVFDDVTKLLTVNVGWGSQRGFTDLTGVVNAGHLHTAGPGGGIGGFGGVLQGLTIADNSADNGLVSTSITLSAPQEALLLAGDTYLNFHTTANGGGEIRGNLVATAIPEPGSMIPLAVLLALFAMIYRRRMMQSSAVAAKLPQ